jgi:hypothetical protein
LTLFLGITVVLIGWVQQPGFRKWLDHIAYPSQVEKADPIDNRLEAVRPKSEPDSFLVAKRQPTEEKTTDGGSFFPGVTAGMFDAIHDDTISSADERPCFLSLMAILAGTDSAKLTTASIGSVAYAQLFRQPRQYRGQLVTVSGVVRGVFPLAVLQNKYGIRSNYQVWLYPLDNPSNPIVVYCLELPKGFPTGVKIAEEAEATGFFFKRWAYPDKDTFRVAPTLAAKTLQWQRRPVMTPEPAADVGWIPLIAAAAAVLALLAAWLIYVRTRPVKRMLPERLPELDVPHRSQEDRESPTAEDLP